MENILNLTNTQILFLFLVEVWILIIFPVIVIRKLNYVIELLESQFQDEQPGQPSA